MKQSYKRPIALGFILLTSTGALLAQPYSFDENGNGFRYDGLANSPAPYQVVADPTEGITSSPVLIYSLEQTVYSGDVELVGPGNAIDGLLRFFTPAGAGSSDVIFYAPVNGTLAGVGIPYSADPVLLTQNGSATAWSPLANEPGRGTGFYPEFTIFDYAIITPAPEASPVALLLVATGVWLTARCFRRKAPSGR